MRGLNPRTWVRFPVLSNWASYCIPYTSYCPQNQQLDFPHSFLLYFLSSFPFIPPSEEANIYATVQSRI